MGYALREALAAFRRAPLLIVTSIVAVSVSLFVFGLFGLAAHNVRQALRQIEERVEVVAYLRDDATPGQVRDAQVRIGAFPEVLEVRHVSKTEALATAFQQIPEFREMFAGIEVNPLPASFEIRLRPGYRNPEATEILAQRLLAFSFVEDAEFGREWLARIVQLQRIAAAGTLLLSGAFAAVAGIIIATAVRVAVFARKDEIEIMRLVGATDGFIRRPFLIEGAIAGLLGGLVAVGLTYLARQVLSVAVIQLEWLPTGWVALAILAGTAYGLAASAVAVRRHLRLI